MDLDDWELNKLKLYLHPRSILLDLLRAGSMHRLLIFWDLKIFIWVAVKNFCLFGSVNSSADFIRKQIKDLEIR